MSDSSLAPRSVLWRDTGMVRVGSFRAHPSHPEFARAGQHVATPEFVFPRRAVRIHREDRAAFVADANQVVFYNPGDRYERSAVSEEGDRCEWFGVTAAAGLDRPFAHAVGPCDLGTYLMQRRIVVRLMRGEVDDLQLDECVLELLARVQGPTPVLAVARPPKPAREWVAQVQEILALRAAEPWTLRQLGAAVGASPFALCRAFRALTGESLHRYRTGLRLRLALERLADPKSDLTGLAGDLGYSSHSHFSAAFRRAFGMTPAQFRGVPRRRT